MFLLAWLGFFAFANALPTPQFLESAATLAAIPAPNHILILTPQAQVQLEPSLKYPKQLVQNLVPVVRIDNPNDQAVVYIPNESLIDTPSKPDQKLKQVENVNITNIVNQAVTAATTAQATLESLQQQLSQGFESLIPTSGQKIEEKAATSGVQSLSTDILKESARLDSGHLYGVTNIPQFYSNIEVIHTPLSPLYAVQPYQTIRARNLVYANDKLAPPAVKDPDLDILRVTDANQNEKVKLNTTKHEQEKIIGLHSSPKYQIEKEQKLQQSSGHFEQFLSSIDDKGLQKDEQLDTKKKENDMITTLKGQERTAESTTFAEALPTGIAVSGEGGLSQSKPAGSAIVGKDGVAYSAPSGTAISGSSSNRKSSTSS